MNANFDIREIGSELRRYAEEEAEFSAQRGCIDDLFPYIWSASKRMSTRAISRWLKAAHNIKLSAATIAKSLRETDESWNKFFERVEPSADIVARAHKYESGRDLLKEDLEHGVFNFVVSNPPMVSGERGYDEYGNALTVLQELWFGVLDDAGREECLASVAYLEHLENEKEEQEDKANETESK